ncbi:MAG: gluconate 2-dehydrogenase subunit 3 family protein [Dyella sp.]
MSSKLPSQSRRDFIRHTMVVAPAVGLLGPGAALAGTPLPAASMSPATEQAEAAGKPYLPRYFTAPEWAFVQAAVDRLIPSNQDGPGALELGVPEFLDREMNAAYGHGGFWYMQGPFVPDSAPQFGYQLRFTPRELYRVAIAAVDKWCQSNHGKPFAQLDGATQDAVLGMLEKGKIALEELPAATFFSHLLQNTKEGYLADPMYGGNKNMGSWKMIGFPGARADFADWSEQPGKVYPLGAVSIEGEHA